MNTLILTFSLTFIILLDEIYVEYYTLKMDLT